MQTSGVRRCEVIGHRAGGARRRRGRGAQSEALFTARISAQGISERAGRRNTQCPTRLDPIFFPGVSWSTTLIFRHQIWCEHEPTNYTLGSSLSAAAPTLLDPAVLMLNERAQIVLSVQPLNGEEDRRLVTDALLRLEGVRTAHVDIPRGVVRVDGAASDVELIATMEALGKRAAVVTHTRGVKVNPPQSGGMLRVQLFMKLLGRQANCCA